MVGSRARIELEMLRSPQRPAEPVIAQALSEWLGVTELYGLLCGTTNLASTANTIGCMSLEGFLGGLRVGRS